MERIEGGKTIETQRNIRIRIIRSVRRKKWEKGGASYQGIVDNNARHVVLNFCFVGFGIAAKFEKFLGQQCILNFWQKNILVHKGLDYRKAIAIIEWMQN